MHFQLGSSSEGKLVRCVAGAIYDVALDLRPDSKTYRAWYGVELTAENRRAIYIPEGFAHGFQTLSDHAEVFYQMFEYYDPDSACGVRWNDKAFDIKWPIENPILSDKDANYPDYMN